MLKLSTFFHPVLGWFTLPRKTARDYTTAEQIEAAALSIPAIRAKRAIWS